MDKIELAEEILSSSNLNDKFFWKLSIYKQLRNDKNRVIKSLIKKMWTKLTPLSSRNYLEITRFITATIQLNIKQKEHFNILQSFLALSIWMQITIIILYFRLNSYLIFLQIFSLKCLSVNILMIFFLHQCATAFLSGRVYRNYVCPGSLRALPQHYISSAANLTITCVYVNYLYVTKNMPMTLYICFW